MSCPLFSATVSFKSMAIIRKISYNINQMRFSQNYDVSIEYSSHAISLHLEFVKAIKNNAVSFGCHTE